MQAGATIKVYLCGTLMSKSKYWPLDYNPECEIYDSLAWDLPGFRRERRVGNGRSSRSRLVEAPKFSEEA